MVFTGINYSYFCGNIIDTYFFIPCIYDSEKNVQRKMKCISPEFFKAEISDKNTVIHFRFHRLKKYTFQEVKHQTKPSNSTFITIIS